jgi:hypothetical protein
VKRHDDPVSAEVQVAAEQAEHRHAAGREPYNESFARGQAELPHDPAVQPGPNYGRGIVAEAGPHSDELGRFSRGQEQLPHDHPEKLVEGSFSDGSEQSPTSR